jgi:hypothetical protein
MTTVETEFAFQQYCVGKSSRQLFFNGCATEGIRANAEFLLTLSPKPDNYEMRAIECSEINYLGPRGVRALLDVVRANRCLLQLTLADQGVTDELVEALVDAIRGNERFGSLDLRDNADITDASASLLLATIKENKMLTNIDVTGTAVGKSVQRELHAIGCRNNALEAAFFAGDYVRLKRIFTELDPDGRGKINIIVLLTHIELPQAAEALERKFLAIDGGMKMDGQLEMNEFLYFTYPTYVKIERVAAHAALPCLDEDIVEQNWFQLVDVIRQNRIEFAALHLVRVYHRVLTGQETLKLVEAAVQNEWYEEEPSEMNADGKLKLRGKCILKAVDDLFGAEMRHVDREREDLWRGMRVSPTVTALMMAQFAVAAGKKSAYLDFSTEYDAPIGALLAGRVETKSLVLKTDVMRQRLLKGGIGPSITVKFSEWLTYVNESYDFAFFGRCEKALAAQTALPWVAPEEARPEEIAADAPAANDDLDGSRTVGPAATE